MFSAFGEQKAFCCRHCCCLLSLLTFKTYEALAELMNMLIEPYSVLGMYCATDDFVLCNIISFSARFISLI